MTESGADDRSEPTTPARWISSSTERPTGAPPKVRSLIDEHTREPIALQIGHKLTGNGVMVLFESCQPVGDCSTGGACAVVPFASGSRKCRRTAPRETPTVWLIRRSE